MLNYLLPDGRIVPVRFDACRGCRCITFTLQGGEVVYAVLVSTDAEAFAAYQDWKRA